MSDPMIRKDLQEILLRLDTGEISKELKGLDAVKEGLTKDISTVNNHTELLHEKLKGKKKLDLVFRSVICCDHDAGIFLVIYQSG
jgi:hypothetical protein